jgi:hypothetical protein
VPAFATALVRARLAYPFFFIPRTVMLRILVTPSRTRVFASRACAVSRRITCRSALVLSPSDHRLASTHATARALHIGRRWLPARAAQDQCCVPRSFADWWPFGRELRPIKRAKSRQLQAHSLSIASDSMRMVQVLAEAERAGQNSGTDLFGIGSRPSTNGRGPASQVEARPPTVAA